MFFFKSLVSLDSIPNSPDFIEFNCATVSLFKNNTPLQNDSTKPVCLDLKSLLHVFVFVGASNECTQT